MKSGIGVFGVRKEGFVCGEGGGRRSERYEGILSEGTIIYSMNLQWIPDLPLSRIM